MTRVEKKLNKDILNAYKKYDQAPIALVPGISPSKTIKNLEAQ
eukprot:CAMPEP_0116875858 /NCGR_PEP_ID=MMETSP0463-20121206/7976_1 /TAXON_ID=181622 /ORGANISM="Strombidinopsis sp, Strain SopsisLIS2011" /LENGTH=42 /DNA_ID= /DNA_START= /DNA_END= /DNA_ORIENTATION=